MKVLGVYDKRELDKIKVNGKTITQIMEEFWKQFPDSYKKNYDANIKSLQLWKIDEHYEECLGEYSDVYNLILFTKKSSIIHELMHMSARDPKSLNNAFARNKDEYLFENALIEGCTEYLASLALVGKVTGYYFETFCASMLSNIDNFFEPYFLADYDKLINIFPEKVDIISLMYSLHFYANNYCLIDEYDGKEKDYFVTRLKHSISDTINTLINIQLSFKMGNQKNLEYGDKFLSLIREKNLYCDLKDIWKDYFSYADNQVKTRILRR